VKQEEFSWNRYNEPQFFVTIASFDQKILSALKHALIYYFDVVDHFPMYSIHRL
jgi:hypothetical protein